MCLIMSFHVLLNLILDIERKSEDKYIVLYKKCLGINFAKSSLLNIRSVRPGTPCVIFCTLLVGRTSTACFYHTCALEGNLAKGEGV